MTQTLINLDTGLSVVVTQSPREVFEFIKDVADEHVDMTGAPA